MGGSVDLPDCLTDAPVFVNHIGDAPGVPGVGRVARAIRYADFPLGVAQQFVREVELFGECPILFDGVEADS